MTIELLEEIIESAGFEFLSKRDNSEHNALLNQLHENQIFPDFDHITIF